MMETDTEAFLVYSLDGDSVYEESLTYVRGCGCIPDPRVRWLIEHSTIENYFATQLAIWSVNNGFAYDFSALDSEIAQRLPNLEEMYLFLMDCAASPCDSANSYEILMPAPAATTAGGSLAAHSYVAAYAPRRG